ncbi:MAG: hypothetical protein WC725_03220 [Patescibacteria group bacterium]|jgi:hypothetical protein
MKTSELKFQLLKLSALVVAWLFVFNPLPAKAGNIADIYFEQSPLFGSTDIVPGDTVAKWVRVINKVNDNLIVTTAASSVINDDHLGDRLNLIIKKNGVLIYSGTMSEFFTASETILGTIAPYQTGQYYFTVSFDNAAGNNFQEKTLSFDIAVSAQVSESIGGETQAPQGGSSGNSEYIISDLNLTNISANLVSNLSTSSITITWLTNKAATSRVVYDTVPHPDLSMALPPNYGYASSTMLDTNKVTSHSVTISGLLLGQAYYLRPISAASPEKFGAELAVIPSGAEQINNTQTYKNNSATYVPAESPENEIKNIKIAQTVPIASPRSEIKGIKISRTSGANNLTESGIGPLEIVFSGVSILILFSLRILLKKNSVVTD